MPSCIPDRLITISFVIEIHKFKCLQLQKALFWKLRSASDTVAVQFVYCPWRISLANQKKWHVTVGHRNMSSTIQKVNKERLKRHCQHCLLNMFCIIAEYNKYETNTLITSTNNSIFIIFLKMQEYMQHCVTVKFTLSLRYLEEYFFQHHTIFPILSQKKCHWNPND